MTREGSSETIDGIPQQEYVAAGVAAASNIYEGEVRMSKRSMLAVAVCTVALAGVSAGGALAGEVKGPPYKGDPVPGGIQNEENSTGAAEHANSLCAFSGLNDYDSEEGQNDRQTQTPKDSPFPGAPGLGFSPAPGVTVSCRGNS
jgi:hypothetical protein